MAHVENSQKQRDRNSRRDLVFCRHYRLHSFHNPFLDKTHMLCPLRSGQQLRLVKSGSSSQSWRVPKWTRWKWGCRAQMWGGAKTFGNDPTCPDHSHSRKWLGSVSWQWRPWDRQPSEPTLPKSPWVKQATGERDGSLKIRNGAKNGVSKNLRVASFQLCTSLK